MRIVAAGTLLLLPLAIAPGLLFYYDVTPKAALLLIGTAAALVMLACGGRIRHPVRTSTDRAFLGLSIALLLLTVVSAVAAPERALAWAGSTWRRYGAIEQCAVLLFALAVAFSARRKFEICWMTRTLALCGLLCSVYGIAQYLGFDPFQDASGYRAGEEIYQIVRPPGTLGHSSSFAAFLIVPAILGVVLFTQDFRAWRYVGLGASISSAIAIVLSGSRAGLLGLACSAAGMILLLRPAAKIVAAVLAVSAIAGAVFYASPLGGKLRARVHWVGEDVSGGARLLLWRDSLRMLAARPVLGYGPENFATAFPQFQSADLSRAYPDFYHESPHNLLLDEALGSGLAAAAVLVGLLLVAIPAYRGARRQFPVLATGLAAALIGLVVAHLFGVLTIPTAAVLFTLVAMLVALGHRHDCPALRMWTVWNVAAVSAAAVFVTTAFVLCASDFRLASVRRHLDSGDTTEALTRYYRLHASRRINVQADLFYSRRFLQAALQSQNPPSRFALAQAAYAAGTFATHAPEQRQNAWYNLAALAAGRNDAAATENALRWSIQASPNWFKPHWSLARLLASTGRAAEANREAQKAINLDGGKHDEVLKTSEAILRSTEGVR